ncbi:hypothetical protein BLA29_010095, partial [Euroglyphus maynei]
MIENCLQIFLLITDPICLPVIRQPIQHCDIMLHYSDCRFQMAEFLREFYGSPKQWLYNLNDDNNIVKQKQSYEQQCCLSYTACHCYDKQYRQKIRQKLLKQQQFSTISVEIVDHYCPGMDGKQSNHNGNCSKIIENVCQWMIPENRRFLLEYQNFFSFSLYCTIMMILSIILYCSFCQQPYCKNILRNQLKRLRLQQATISPSPPLFQRPIIIG